MLSRDFYCRIVVLLLAATFLAWNLSVVCGGLLDQGMGYVSDDVWYVSSARNMLRKFWGLQPKAVENGMVYATVLTYNDESYSRALKLLDQSGSPYRIFKDDYKKSLRFGWGKAFAILASEDVLEEVESLERVEVYCGYPYPDYSGIIEYMNFEHPPLVKYILALTMLVDDRPLTWRIPSLVLGSVILVLTYLVAKRIFGEMAGIAAAVFVFTEQTVRAMSMVAMLDIYVSFFTILALYFALSERSLLSALVIGLAGSAKMSGFFTAPGLLISFLRRSKLKVLLPIAVLALVYFALSIPVMLYLGGVMVWVDEFLGALKWHVTPRPEGPPSTNPLGLLLGFNSFPLSFTPPVTASPNFLLNLSVIPLTFILAPLAVRGILKGFGTVLAWFWSAYLGYVALYLAGNTTLYSFYAVQFTPLAAVIGGGIIYLIENPKRFVEALKIYLETFTGRVRLEVE